MFKRKLYKYYIGKLITFLAVYTFFRECMRQITTQLEVDKLSHLKKNKGCEATKVIDDSMKIRGYNYTNRQRHNWFIPAPSI
jgi:hypothetical protein